MFDTLTRMGASAAGEDYVIDKSLRLNNEDSSRLDRSVSSASNRKTWTLSIWFKRGKNLSDESLWAQGDQGSNRAGLLIVDHKLIVLDTIGSPDTNLTTTATLRDPGWYHAIVQYDTTQATAANRAKLYLNGVHQIGSLLSTATYQAQNTDGNINSTVSGVRIGANPYNSSLSKSACYISEIHFIDGSIVPTTTFGKFNSNGKWIPKEVKGVTYGTNGYYLNFKDKSGSTATTMGKDSSGNSNNFTPTNLPTHDVVTDNPTNNFPIQNLNQRWLRGAANHGGLDWGVYYGGEVASRGSSFAVKGGKWFMELRIAEGTYAYPGGHPMSGGMNFAGPTMRDPDNSWLSKEIIVPYHEHLYSNGGIVQSGLAGFNKGDVASFAVDCDNFTAQCYKNGSSYGNQVDWSGHSNKNNLFLGMQAGSGGTNWQTGQHFNYGQDSTFAGTETAGNNADANGYGDFSMSVPSGYLALCTQNLPDTYTIKDGTKHFDVLLWTGNGSNDRDITGLSFQPDFFWIKERSSTSDYRTQDAVRGATKVLRPGSADAVIVRDEIDNFLSNGYHINGSSDGIGAVNENSQTYVSFNWKANGAGSSNTDGTITATVSANATAGFSIVKYTGNGSSSQYVGHGLGAVPQLIFHKNLSSGSTNWLARSTARDGSIDWAYLNTNAGWSNASGDYTNAWTSTKFSIGTDNVTNTSGDDYIAYCFSEVYGYSAIGNYLGTGSTDGAFIHTGFRPAFLLIKKHNSTDSWNLWDTTRDPHNLTFHRVFCPGSDAESTGTSDSTSKCDIYSNGFKWRGTSNDTNGSGDNYIYYAIADQPFKYANPR